MQLNITDGIEFGGTEWTVWPERVREEACSVIRTEYALNAIPTPSPCVCHSNSTTIDWQSRTKPHKLVGAYLHKVGISMSDYSKSRMIKAAEGASVVGYHYDIVDRMDWDPGDFGEKETSCWWGGYWRSRCVVFPALNGRAIRAYRDVEGTLRAGRAVLLEYIPEAFEEGSDRIAGFFIMNEYGISKEHFLSHAIRKAQEKYKEKFVGVPARLSIQSAYINNDGYVTFVTPESMAHRAAARDGFRSSHSFKCPATMPEWTRKHHVDDVTLGRRANEKKKLYWVDCGGEGLYSHVWTSDLRITYWVPDPRLYPLSGAPSYAAASAPISALDEPFMLYSVMAAPEMGLKEEANATLRALSSVVPEDVVRSEKAREAAIKFADLTPEMDTKAKRVLVTFQQFGQRLRNYRYLVMSGSTKTAIEREKRAIESSLSMIFIEHGELFTACNALAEAFLSRVLPPED